MHVHVQLSSHRGNGGCRAVCTDPGDYSAFTTSYMYVQWSRHRPIIDVA